MRWISYFILAYVSVGVQVGASAFARFHGATPNVVLLVAIFLVMNADAQAGLLGCFMLGLMTDLVSQQPLGLYALAFGLVGTMISATSKELYKGHPLTHFFLALLGGLVCATLLWIYGFVRVPSSARTPLMSLLAGALYTALLAPIVLGLLHRMRGIFGFETSKKRRRYSN